MKNENDSLDKSKVVSDAQEMIMFLMNFDVSKLLLKSYFVK